MPQSQAPEDRSTLAFCVCPASINTMIGTSPASTAFADVYRLIRDDLARAEAVFQAELQSDLSMVNELAARASQYRGKMLRPSLLLLMARAGGKLTPDHHVVAAVVEMVHVATLVHDDVLDAADERRGQPTIKTLSGNVAAVLLGDYLISHAYHLCSSLKDQHAARRIGATTNTVCEGELLQNHHRGDPDLTVATYMDIIARKTGALTATACELGAYHAGCDPRRIEAARQYGMSLGVAFQIVDDVLDITGDAHKVGKTLGIDLALGKLTLPVLHGLGAASPEVQTAIRDAVTQRSSVSGDQLRRWLDQTASIDFALAQARHHVADALSALHEFPPSDARTSLQQLAGFVVQRQQ